LCIGETVIAILLGVALGAQAAAAPIGMPSLPPVVISDFTNAPNPVDTRKGGPEGQTQISYTLASNSPVTLTLYDLFGFKVRTWRFSPGQDGGRTGPNDLLWDGTNDNGQKVSKGGYIAQLEIETPQTTATAFRKIAVIH